MNTSRERRPQPSDHFVTIYNITIQRTTRERHASARTAIARSASGDII
jgi:hypothetical protein